MPREISTTPQSVRTHATFRLYQGLLVDLIDNPDCEGFLQPVLELWSEDAVPGYKDRILHPMDLGSVKDRLRDGIYVGGETPSFWFDTEKCSRDIRLIFTNCMLYNDPVSALHATAKTLLSGVDAAISAGERRVAGERGAASRKAKRDSERRRRKKAEEVAAAAAAGAKRAQLQLERLRREAEDAQKKKELELKSMQAEWQQRMEAEKRAAVAKAVQEALAKQRKERRLVGTSSVSSDEAEIGNREVCFAFVSTAGMEKKRGRKSGLVMELEAGHEDLMRRRKAMVEASVELESLKQVEMTYAEKRKVCEQVAGLDFVRMKKVVDIIAKGMNRPDILNEVDIDVDIDHIDNVVLREVQFFLSNPVASTAKDSLRKIETDIATIESKLVSIRYQKVSH